MWNRKELKQKGKKTVKKNYWKAVLICFIMAYFAGAYNTSSSTTFLVAYNEDKEDESVVQTNIQDRKSNSDIVNEMLDGVGKTGNEEYEKKYYRGVFSSIFNNVTESGSFLFGFLNAFNEGVFHDKVGYSFVILFGALISLLYWLLFQNVLAVNQCRFFLEAAAYEKTPVNRMLFLLRIRRWCHGVMIMFFKWLYTLLWQFTIVGGMIKHYSYMMIPYIVAENPNVTKKEAFALSRSMMYGNKWNAFLLDLSYLGWTILSILTLGLVGIFYSNPYITATKTELYLHLREKAILEQLVGYELFNDQYIGLHPTVPDGLEELPPLYPTELFTIPEHEKRRWVKVEYRRNYSLRSLILLFFTFSIIGWLWEVSLHLTTDGFVNRGVLHGPWLPIYGTGGVLVLVLLKKVRDNPVLTFFLTVVICGVVEYFTSYWLEVTKGAKWWDYSGYLLNLNGRICAEGLLVFGLGGCAFIYFAAPVFDELYKKIPLKVQVILCVLLLGLFGIDQVYSHSHPNMGKGITDYAYVEELRLPEVRRKAG